MVIEIILDSELESYICSLLEYLHNPAKKTVLQNVTSRTTL
jgi:hypothetical protein